MAEENDEPTVECPNCGALVPVGAPRCFICEELMPLPAKAEVKAPELAPEELPPVEKAEAEAPKPVQEVAAKPLAEPVVEKPPKEILAPVQEAIEAAPAKPTAAEEKAAKLKTAFEAGRIPKDVYVGNLRALGITVPPELEEETPEVQLPPEAKPEIAVEAPPVNEVMKEKPPAEGPPAATASLNEKAAKLKAAYEAGRIPKEVYVENLRILGATVPPEMEEPPVKEEAPVEIQREVAAEVPAVEAKVQEKPPEELPPAKPIVEEDKAAKLRAAYEAGIITREVYVGNLKTLGIAVPAELEQPPAEEEIAPTAQPEAIKEIQVVKEEVTPPRIEEKPVEEAAPPTEEVKATAPPKPSATERKAARLKRAYETGRITKGMYEDSLKTLGVSTQKARRPPPSIAPAFEIEAAPPKVEEKPPVEEAKAVPAKQSVAEKKAARLKRAYETGRITKGMYEDSLKKLSAVAPPEPKVAPAMEAAPEVRSAVEEAARPPPEEKLPEKVASPPEIAEPALAAPSEDEVRAAKLKAAYESGAITKEVYKGNLTMLGLPVPSELEKEPEVAAWTPPAEVISGLKAEAAEEVLEVTPQVEEEAESPRAEEASAEGVEAAPAAVLPVSKGEAEGPGRSYRGVAIASAGGLMYVLIWLLFVPMLGNFLSFVLTALGAILIVVGYNVASNDSAAAKRARTFRCPLCSERLQMSVSECPNCGAKFIDSRQ